MMVLVCVNHILKGRLGSETKANFTFDFLVANEEGELLHSKV